MKAFTALVVLQIALLSSPFCLCQNPEEKGDHFEGDMVDFVPSISSRSGVINLRYRWKSNTIPYDFDSAYPSDLRDLFTQATQHIASRTCIKFVKRTTEADYVHVKSDRGCYSNVGKVGGKQVISLPKECKSLGTFVHEIIHSIGFHHEQSRTDRDDFVRINYNNVESGFARNFDKYGTNLISPFGVNYDYGSVMHYSKYAFTKNNQPTIVPINSNVEIGQRRGMSTGDVAKIKNMYNC